MGMADLVHLSFPQWGQCEAHSDSTQHREAKGVLQISAVISVHRTPARRAAKEKTAHPSEPLREVQLPADTQNWDGLALILDICS